MALAGTDEPLGKLAESWRAIRHASARRYSGADGER